MKTKTSLLFVTVLFTAGGMAAAPPMLSEESIFSEAEKGNVAILELARQMPVEQADSMLREVERRFESRRPEVVLAAHQLLGDLPGMAEYYEKGLAELPVLIENDGLRSRWMKVVASIPKRWALELLVKLLDDKRPLTTRYDEATMKALLDQGDSAPGTAHTNAEMACRRLAWRYRDKIPLPRISMFKTYSEAELLKVRPWWEAHKNEPDSYFFDGEMWQAEIAGHPKGINWNVAQVQQAAPLVKAAPVVKAGETATPPGSPWATYGVVAAVTTMTAAALLPWLLRRRKRP